MIRKIIKIDQEKCNGCGACASACHEGALGMVLGKAKLMREDYCDGLGDCLPACPTGAITFEEREAPAYDHEAVMANKAKKESQVKQSDSIPCGDGYKRQVYTNDALEFRYNGATVARFTNEVLSVRNINVENQLKINEGWAYRMGKYIEEA